MQNKPQDVKHLVLTDHDSYSKQRRGSHPLQQSTQGKGKRQESGRCGYLLHHNVLHHGAIVHALVGRLVEVHLPHHDAKAAFKAIGSITMHGIARS